jgi:hypothetical protein
MGKSGSIVMFSKWIEPSPRTAVKYVTVYWIETGMQEC